jgi:putative IMPACT (imprinted ancient) family translation regulator
VLRGSDLGDVAVVVTRYFGGTKLGTGGLVRAYGDAVRAVLTALPRAVKVSTHVVQVVTPYSGFERLRRLVAAHGGQVLDEDFQAEVTVCARFAVERFPAFENALQEAFSGTLAAEIVARDEIAIVPV